MAIKILIVDDHPLFRGALRLAAEGAVDRAEIREAADFDAAVAAIVAEPGLDLVLLDLNLPGAHGFSGLLLLRAQYPALPVVMVSGSAAPTTVSLAMQFGAAGFVPKTSSIEDMRAAFRQVLAGGSWTPPNAAIDIGANADTAELAAKMARLTPQQLRVLTMLSDGLLNKQIAYALDVSEATVKAHVSAILQKLDVDSRTQAVIAASRIMVPGRAAAGGI